MTCFVLEVYHGSLISLITLSSSLRRTNLGFFLVVEFSVILYATCSQSSGPKLGVESTNQDLYSKDI